MKAADIKRGSVVEIDGQIHVAEQLEAKSPSSRGASTLYKIRFRNVQTGQKLDRSLKGDEQLKDADLQRRAVQFSYRDGEHCVFMDQEDFSQYSLSEAELDGQQDYLSEGLEGIMVLIADDKPIGIELPQSVTLEIIDTAPALKGATAAGRTKPARLGTGLEVQVPEYLGAGESIKINTETGRFMSRA
ncbi:elongation factor P-like protein YeiP [Alkalilimnicola sp. S0819]|uniref:elongation factor P-like protein EfpL n=1 Tax=Alkalilimnicola sp. S0819 TaxID=2613922 RepID=UPI001262AC3D|nr:elongation factor P-like protein YeiP [Alkalilimnicola sp. S0819]KAB7619653.1 elongation factor P-like protein YeiP [Alkalilimnicola sp. S0819]MPQ17591.1 elongation factor P-like protein YeiP [Alkalilimnicola sp. S0819]